MAQKPQNRWASFELFTRLKRNQLTKHCGLLIRRGKNPNNRVMTPGVVRNNCRENRNDTKLNLLSTTSREQLFRLCDRVRTLIALGLVNP